MQQLHLQRPQKAVNVTDGAEIDLTGDDAELLFDRMELVSFASDSIFSTLQQQFDAPGAAQPADDDIDENKH